MPIMKSDIPLGEYCPSVGQMLRERKLKRPENVMLMEKFGGVFQSHKTSEIYHEISMIGTGLLKAGLNRGDRVGIISRNRREMLVLELAVMSVGGISTPVFSEYPHPQLDHTLGNAQPRFIVVDTPGHLEELKKTSIFMKTKRIFLMEAGPEISEPPGGKILPFRDLYGFGFDSSRFEQAVDRTRPNDPCLIQYTSGTTGLPKGVVLTHRNILSQRKAQEHLWNLTPEDRFLSYLPWHHSFGGIFERFTALYFSCVLAIDDSLGKDLSLLIKNYFRVKPTVYFSVPKIYQSLVNECRKSESIEKQIFHPDLKFVFTAAAPLPKDVEQYISGRNVQIIEGWGLTETSPCVTLTSKDDQRCAHVVGKPIPGVQVKISSEGEILVKGPNVMAGYFGMPQKTEKTLTRGGWLRTGDMGEITPGGLLLKGRTDGIFKLSNGEKIFSQIVEMQLIGSSEYIDQAILAGSGGDFVSVLIFPDFKALENVLKADGIHLNDRFRIVENEIVRQLFKAEIERINQEIYPHFFRAKAFALIPDEFSIFRGELTPSLKIVKPKVMQNYAPLIDAIYHPATAGKKLLRDVIYLDKNLELEAEMILV